jgi:hypothetical protein
MIMQAMCEELNRITVSMIVTGIEVTILGALSLTDKSAYQSVLWCQQYSVTFGSESLYLLA